MYILVGADGKLLLQDSDNMGAFSIVEAESGAAGKHLGAIATAAEDNHYWLDAEAVIRISGRMDDARWIGDFWNMLARVEAYGYSDLTKKRVKAHVELGK